jgi:hypothetical protein
MVDKVQFQKSHWGAAQPRAARYVDADTPSDTQRLSKVTPGRPVSTKTPIGSLVGVTGFEPATSTSQT